MNINFPAAQTLGDGIRTLTACTLWGVVVSAGLAVGAAPALAQSRTIWGTGYVKTGVSPNTGFDVVLAGTMAKFTSVATICNTTGQEIVGNPGPVGGTNVNTPGFFLPAVPPGTMAQSMTFNRNGFGNLACVGPRNALGTITANFSSPIDPNALRFHFFNLDAGTYGFSSNVVPGRLAGNNIFDVVGQEVNSVAATAAGGGCQANNGSNPSASCGTVNFTSSSPTVSNFQIAAYDVDNTFNAGDGHAIALSVTQPSLRIRKRRTNGAGAETYTFGYPANVVSNSADGGTAVVSETINVSANGVYTDGLLRYIANSGLDTQIAETLPAGYVASGTCYDVANASATIATVAANGSVTLPAAAVLPTSQIECDFTNTWPTDLSITKQNADPTGGRVERGATTRYSLTVTNAGPGISTNAIVRDTPSAGLNCVAANSVACTGPAGACPTGAVTVGNLTGAAGVTLDTLAVGASLSLQFDCVVQ
jgi:uncharacterized repeat protein (TIGR01451 family)